MLWPSKRGISAGLPFVLAQANQIENAFDSAISFVTLGAADVHAGHRVAAHDPLGVTLSWDAATGAPRARGEARASTPIVRGCPYLTMEYEDATPVFDSPQQLDPQVKSARLGGIGGRVWARVWARAAASRAPSVALAHARSPPLASRLPSFPSPALTPHPRNARRATRRPASGRLQG